METEIQVGCVPITWGRWMRDDPAAFTQDRVLSEIARAGYAGAATGPRADRPDAEVLAQLAQHGLKPAPGYLSGEWWDPDQLAAIRDKAKRQIDFCHAAGLTELFVAADGFAYASRASGKTRRELAGHVGPNDGLSDDEYRHAADGLNEIGAMLAGAGVRAAFHNHVGTVIETEEELERLLGLVDPAALALGPDTGHLAWAGADVTAVFRRHAARIVTAHLKDVDAAVRDRGRDEAWDYGTFTDRGVFVELGEGCVDFPELLAILRGAGFHGWLLAETDVTQKPSALESAVVSRNYLKSIGL